MAIINITLTMSTAFHWIINLFVEYLPVIVTTSENNIPANQLSHVQVKELLLLWDRVLGFDSLELLPLLAAGIFIFRGPDLIASTSADEVSKYYCVRYLEFRVICITIHYAAGFAGGEPS